MTQKERLVELLCKCGFPTLWNTKYEDFQTAVEEIAEKLLDNGVIVPPCKVGDTVYSIGGEDNNVHEERVSWCSYDSTDKTFLFQTTSTDQFVLEDMGRTVFFSREEAEQALKYMQTKG